MTQLSTTVQYSSDVNTAETPLLIEQKEWSLYTGTISKQEVVSYLKSVINSEEYQMDINCGMTGDELVVAIYVYPYFRDLDYKLYTSYGTLSNKTVEMIEVDSELVQFRLSKSESTQYPVAEFSSVSWILTCLDINGDEVKKPDLRINGNSLDVDYKVYGTAEVSYLTEKHSYILTIPRRTESLDNNFSAIIVGAMLGYKPVIYNVKMPPTVDSFILDSSYSCGSGGKGSTSEEDQQLGPIEATPVNLVTVVDYCTQKITKQFFE